MTGEAGPHSRISVLYSGMLLHVVCARAHAWPCSYVLPPRRSSARRSGHPPPEAVIHPPKRPCPPRWSIVSRARATGARARDAKKEGRAVTAGLGPRRARARARAPRRAWRRRATHLSARESRGRKPLIGTRKGLRRCSSAGSEKKCTLCFLYGSMDDPLLPPWPGQVHMASLVMVQGEKLPVIAHIRIFRVPTRAYGCRRQHPRRHP